MPVNEIQAPYYVRLRYQTWAAEHNLTLYLGAGTLAKQADGDYRLTALECWLNPNGSVSKLVKDLFDNIYHTRSLRHVGINNIELWQSVGSAPNVFLDFVTFTTPLIANSHSVGVASSHVMITGVSTGSTQRQVWRLTFFEALSAANPQRWPLNVSSATVGINAVLKAYTMDCQGLVTQDGWPIVIRAWNEGYNRALARRYGRTLFP